MSSSFIKYLKYKLYFIKCWLRLPQKPRPLNNHAFKFENKILIFIYKLH